MGSWGHNPQRHILAYNSTCIPWKSFCRLFFEWFFRNDGIVLVRVSKPQFLGTIVLMVGLTSRDKMCWFREVDALHFQHQSRDIQSRDIHIDLEGCFLQPSGDCPLQFCGINCRTMTRVQGGGFNDLFCFESWTLGKLIQFDLRIGFWVGWNHQLEWVFRWTTTTSRASLHELVQHDAKGCLISGIWGFGFFFSKGCSTVGISWHLGLHDPKDLGVGVCVARRVFQSWPWLGPTKGWAPHNNGWVISWESKKLQAP